MLSWLNLYPKERSLGIKIFYCKFKIFFLPLDIVCTGVRYLFLRKMWDFSNFLYCKTVFVRLGRSFVFMNHKGKVYFSSYSPQIQEGISSRRENITEEMWEWKMIKKFNGKDCWVLKTPVTSRKKPTVV